MSWQGQVDAWGRPVEHTGGAADATQQAWAAHAAAQQQYAQHVATGYGQHAQGTATQYGQANPQQQASAYQQAYQQHYQQNAYQQNAYQQTAYQQTAYQQPHAQAGTKQLGGKDGPGQPGNWFCPSCNNENWPSRHSCNRCKVPKPGGQNGGVQAVHNTGGGGLQVLIPPCGASAGFSFPTADARPKRRSKNRTFLSREILEKKTRSNHMFVGHTSLNKKSISIFIYRMNGCIDTCARLFLLTATNDIN